MAEAKELSMALRAYAEGDFATALAKGKPLAENGVPAAQKLLGDMYLTGRGGLQASESEARAWYEKAAVGGNPYAKTALDKLDAKSGSSAPQ
jgi:TPR repeat protein